jgi:hypothetical protein
MFQNFRSMRHILERYDFHDLNKFYALCMNYLVDIPIIDGW